MATPHKPAIILTFSMITMVVFAFAIGLMLPLIAYRLNAQGYSYSIITLSTVIAMFGVTIAGPFISRISNYMSAVHLLAASLIFNALLAAFVGATDSLLLLWVLRFMQGLCIATTFVVSETWINQALSKHNRGFWMGVYMASSAGGFAGGPLLLAWVGANGWLPFIYFIVIIISPLPFLWIFRHNLPDFSNNHSEAGFIKACKAAPFIMLVVLTASYFDSAGFTLLGPYMIRAGLDEQSSFLILSLMFVGNALLQIPIGYLTSKFNRKIMVAVMSLIAACIALFLPEVVKLSTSAWFIFTLWGGVGYGIMTIALIEVGDRFRNRMLMLVNTALATTWGLSGILSSTSGIVADLHPERGLGFALAAPFIAIILLSPFVKFVNEKHNQS